MAIRYVNTGSTPGGDGTTNATSGANRAYASLSEWEAARQAVLSAPEEVICEGSTADTTAVTVDGWTASGTNYILIHGSTASSGYWDTSKYRLSVNGQALRVDEAFTTVRDLQVEEVGGAGAAFRFQAANQLAERCIIRTDTVGAGNCISGSTSNIGAIFRNCFIHSRGTTSKGYDDTGSSTGAAMQFQNCTFIGNGSTCFVVKTAATNLPVIRNCLVQGFTTFSSGGGLHATCNYNATDLATASGGANDRVSQTFTFVNAGSGDYHLASGDAGALDFGEDLSGLGFSDDIEGNTRSGSWDIGADEFVTSGVTITVLCVPSDPIAHALPMTAALTMGAIPSSERVMQAQLDNTIQLNLIASGENVSQATLNASVTLSVLPGEQVLALTTTQSTDLARVGSQENVPPGAFTATITTNVVQSGERVFASPVTSTTNLSVVPGGEQVFTFTISGDPLLLLERAPGNEQVFPLTLTWTMGLARIEDGARVVGLTVGSGPIGPTVFVELPLTALLEREEWTAQIEPENWTARLEPENWSARIE